ncbi:putative duf500 domain-containing protein [Erysiphe neolycopersici]|uniref:Putative duf500 domain-containing protein n=1 Tax=Erysiphe neolycopersici TaxID=212602 RepID=A0A420HZ87_9PEZI|nr:putative duf500 domain-containing protein [Erysiphe neolycopersici]
MRRVTSLLPSWENSAKADSKPTFDKTWSWSETKHLPSAARSYSTVLATELQMLTESSFASDKNFSNTTEVETFWPSTLDKESEKAARILHSFCSRSSPSKNNLYLHKGVTSYSENGSHVDLDQFQDQSPFTPNSGPRPLAIIPRKIIQNAVGLAIFTASRAGLWISGSGGSGVLVARKEDGDWSPPSGILLQTSRLSFAGGVDIYDCIIVFNDRKSLNRLTGVRTIIGEETPTPSGPLFEIGSGEEEETCTNTHHPILTYLKSRGFHSNVSLDGALIIGRVEENKRFYGSRLGVVDILAGKIQQSSNEVKLLLETIKFSEGCSDANKQVIQQLAMQASPSEAYMYSSRTSSFGIPEAEDPDPFGVLALERAGLEIRESGSRSRPSSTQFEYHPSPTSPIFARLNRRSIDTQMSRSNRGSYISTRTRTSIDRSTQTMNMATQTDDLWTPNTSPTGSEYTQSIEEPFHECDEIESAKIPIGTSVALETCQEDVSNTKLDDFPRVNPDDHKPTSLNPKNVDEDEIDNFEPEDEEEPIIFEAASAQATVLQSAKKAGGGLVHIPKRGPPPPVPARSASRGTIDSSTLNALRYKFENADISNSQRNRCDDKYLKYSHIILPNYTAPLSRWDKTFEGNKFTAGFPNSPARS